MIKSPVLTNNFDYIYSCNTNMFKTVLLILGIRDTELMIPTTLLSNIGMDDYKRHQIKKSIKQNFGVKLFDDDLDQMTVGKMYDLSVEIQQFQNQLINNGTNEPNKLTNLRYFLNLAEDKIRSDIPNTICYELPNKFSSLNTESCAILLPGLETDSKFWPNIANELRFSTFLVKYGMVERKIETLADGILKDIQEVCHQKKSYLLVGYSFGSLVAIELARRLESLQRNVKIICVDGSPLLFRYALNDFGYNVDGDAIDLKVATQIAHIIQPTILPSIFRHKLKPFKSWDDKVAYLVDLTRTLNFCIPEENLKNICYGLFNRIYAAATYQFSFPQRIRSLITLIKPTEETIAPIEDDYGLQSYTSGSVDIKTVEGNHYTLLQNSVVVHLMNVQD